ncbi:putative nuclease of restriction endonuclease-like (RecB) superfamily [Variovorax boronicumulans]|uniref:PDDEXK nuclease domain-containing protein n=1 Tax=Variovorax TaxID=34072 RepID=UPI00278A88EB|nr:MULTISPECIES: PDDEXK nuclease domain-containing protein [Variovorax]MDQ0033760.1 putative nuclease of restriction endonuclease-like (RecB) superfamily [Variovorax boronicumulans]MDQ0042771.1 putative nuclease of restriction endonuclease-like (RecB) superfamily [Variovorax boronicumulans]MDQ0611755.1 putative nuclease of restriction endonuclease-like (RecB) superfamily [Variovorax sp. W1I1]
MKLSERDDYGHLLTQIGDTFTRGRVQALRAANQELLATYWQVGRHIVEFEQAGQARAEYGKALIEQLARDLTLRHGKGFSRSNLIRIRQFYLLYPKGATLSHQLSWSHVVELLKIDDPLERGFYEQQSVNERWSVRELVRQKDSALFLRLAASRDKAGILKLASEGQVVEQPVDLLREPYVFEFLKIPEPAQVSETQLEALLCDHLQQFLLELGKGFTYVGRQYRITLNNSHYKVDLVFYHRILRCFVLIDLKLGDVQHHDIGQMNLYLGYFANEENAEGDNPPIGIILSRHKDELLVEYATYNLNSQLFVQKYQLYLPEREELRRELESTLREAGE